MLKPTELINDTTKPLRTNTFSWVCPTDKELKFDYMSIEISKETSDYNSVNIEIIDLGRAVKLMEFDIKIVRLYCKDFIFRYKVMRNSKLVFTVINETSGNVNTIVRVW